MHIPLYMNQYISHVCSATTILIFSFQPCTVKLAQGREVEKIHSIS